jgi:hypothetical protein
VDTANINNTNAIYISKDAVQATQDKPLLRRRDFDNEQQKPALIEGEQLESSKLVVGNEDVFQRAEDFKQTSNYDDTVNLRVRKELELYQSIDKQNQREDISQLLGVDIFA